MTSIVVSFQNGYIRKSVFIAVTFDYALLSQFSVSPVIKRSVEENSNEFTPEWWTVS